MRYVDAYKTCRHAILKRCWHSFLCEYIAEKSCETTIVARQSLTIYQALEDDGYPTDLKQFTHRKHGSIEMALMLHVVLAASRSRSETAIAVKLMVRMVGTHRRRSAKRLERTAIHLLSR